jgi:SAM-dependent methyltransferase
VLNDQREHFDELFGTESDPWGYRSSWPEQRRHQLMLAMLEERSYRSAFEPGCANGTFTALLAHRADGVLAWDGSPAAVDLARAATKSMQHVTIAVGSVPQQWPDDDFDLIVLADFLYYLDPSNLRAVARLAAERIRAGGLILACHWLGSAHDFRIAGGTRVHGLLESEFGAPTGPRYLDDRQVIGGWRG